MIPVIGIMIACYIIMRCLEVNYSEGRDGLKWFAALVVVVSGIAIYLLINSALSVDSALKHLGG